MMNIRKYLRYSFSIIPHPHKITSINKINNLSFSFSTTTVNTNLLHNLELNKYLKQNLQNNHIHELKQFQKQSFQIMSSNNNNIFINSCTGSGKTLSYLLPIMNKLLNQIQKYQTIHNQKQQRKIAKKHGAIILTLNKQLCLQIYKNIRILDPQNRLNIKRTGPISHYIPIITQLNNQPKTQQQGDIIDAKINKNLVNTIKWTNTDILISTPQLLYNIMSMGSYGRDKKDIIWPQFVVIDQADILLQLDRNVSGYTNKLIDQFNRVNKQLGLGNKRKRQINIKQQKQNESDTINNNNKIQYFISASSFPTKINKIQYKQALLNKFPSIKFIQGQSQHQIPSTIDLYFIQTHKMPNNKSFYLKDIISNRKGQRAIIFCNNKKSIQQIQNTIQQLQQQLSQQYKQQYKINSQVYHASLDSNQRSRVLSKFEKGQANILISTDLGSRGLDFTIPINYIIQYQMSQNITNFINRVGRTGRNNIKGQVITMVSQGNQELFKHIEILLSKNQKLDQLFSRKRSYNKLYKDKYKYNENEKNENK